MHKKKMTDNDHKDIKKKIFTVKDINHWITGPVSLWNLHPQPLELPCFGLDSPHRSLPAWPFLESVSHKEVSVTHRLPWAKTEYPNTYWGLEMHRNVLSSVGALTASEKILKTLAKNSFSRHWSVSNFLELTPELLLIYVNIQIQ